MGGNTDKFVPKDGSIRVFFTGARHGAAGLGLLNDFRRGKKDPAPRGQTYKEVKIMSANKIPYKMYLSEDEMPKTWLNLKAFMPE